MAIKVKDLAVLCNISRGNADRALNNRPGVNAEARKRILEKAKEAGLLCTSDHFAMKIYQAAREKGYKLPDDFALMGFDGVDVLRYLPQRIDSVKYPAAQIGTKAAEMLSEYREGIRPENCVFQRSVMNGDTVCNH